MPTIKTKIAFLRELLALKEVIDLGQIQAAAERNGFKHSNMSKMIADLEEYERQRTGIRTLKLGYNRVFGYYIEISKGNIPLVKEEWGYDRKQTLANCERFINPVLKEKEDLVLSAEEKIINFAIDITFSNINYTPKTYCLFALALIKSKTFVIITLFWKKA